MKEHRLIGITKAQLDAQRKKAGATPVTTQYSTSAAQANAQLQADAYQQSLAENQAANPNAGTWIDPKTGIDSRPKDDAGNPIDALGTFISSTGPNGVQTRNAANVRAEQMQGPLVQGPENAPTAAGVLNQAGNAGQFQTYNTQTGQSTVQELGKIDQSAVDRLVASGMTEGEARRQVQGNRTDVQDAFDQVGTGKTDMQIRAEQSGATRLPTDIRAGLQPDSGLNLSPEQAAQINAANAAANTEQMKQEQLQQEKAKLAETSTATQTDIPVPPSSAGTGAAFANLPPEAQFLAPYLQQFQDSINQSLQENAGMYTSTMEGIQKTFGGIEEKLSDMETGYKTTADAIQGLLQTAKEENEKALAEQQKSEQQRLVWEEVSQLRTLSKQKAQQHDAMIANFALNDAGGQIGAANAVMESDIEFENRMQDLAVEFGYMRNDLAAKYSGLYAENNNNFTQATIQNAKELQSALERIGMQGISNATARQQAEQNALTTAFNNQTNLRQTLATQNLNVAGQITELLMEKQRMAAADRKAESDRDWQERKFYEQMDYQFEKQLTAADIAETKRVKSEEFAEQKNVRTAFDKANSMDSVKRYKDTKTNYDKISSILDAAEKGDDVDWEVAKEAVVVLWEKGIDPDSVVREGEYARAGLAQNIITKIRNEVAAWTGGTRTGLSKEVTRAFKKAVGVLVEPQRNAAEAEYAQAVNYLVDFNNRSQYYNINPQTVVPAEFMEDWVLQSYFGDQQSNATGSSYNMNWSDYSESGGGGSDVSFGNAITSLGRLTQNFNTPISTGLYAQSTVNAWGGKHAGVDIAVPQGSDVLALVDGEVIDFGYEDGWGGTIIIRDSNGGEHRISHLSEISPNISVGQTIKKGMKIALSGGKKGTRGAGNSTGPHIDYRIRVNGKYVDPLTYNPNKLYAQL